LQNHSIRSRSLPHRLPGIGRRRDQLLVPVVNVRPDAAEPGSLGLKRKAPREGVIFGDAQRGVNGADPVAVVLFAEFADGGSPVARFNQPEQ
jgi:hypothetical protein